MNEAFELTTEEKEGTTIDTNNLFTTQYDVIRDSTKVHSKLKEGGIVTSDLIYAKFNDKEREYIEEQMRSATSAYNLITEFDQETALRVYNNLTKQPQMMAILRRNMPNNYLMKLINKGEEKDEEEAKGMLEGLTIRKKKKRNQNKRREENEDEFYGGVEDEFEEEY